MADGASSFVASPLLVLPVLAVECRECRVQRAECSNQLAVLPSSGPFQTACQAQERHPVQTSFST